MAQLALFFGLFLCLGLLPPARWGIRIAAALLILLAIASFVLPTPYDPGWGYDFIRAVVLWTMAALLAGVALRVLLWLMSGPRTEASVADDRALARFDHLLVFAAGVGLGFVAFQTLAVLLQGVAGGLALHLGVAVAAIVAVALMWRTHLRTVGLGAGMVVAALALDGGIRYPDLILRAADASGKDVPRCLMIGPDLAPPRARSDLMALTMPKDLEGPSDTLLLRRPGDHQDLRRWSFRGRAFVRGGDRYDTPGLCAPTLAPLLPG